MIPIILLGAALLATTAVVASVFWDDIKKFLKAAIEHVRRIIKATIVGLTAYIKTKDISAGIQAGLQALNKFYSKNENEQWEETVVTRQISSSEVPEHIRKKLERTQAPVDISDDVAKELQLEI
ncbi:hypothetical protein [Pseudomonas luteola]|uniref:hypothetical protein n=1 Tax=Pseudomonas luteola TaxID=47886 RepID=UPI0009187067|nr:hypothetical protein [Pseudomonas zeshuii]SHJ68816.1 hypothetical protein SAMN05216295_12258 [Pseudomonas zeshuii]